MSDKDRLESSAGAGAAVPGAECAGVAGAASAAGHGHALYDGVVAALRSVYDPEIPVNIYDLGLVYDLEVGDDGQVRITMTLTAPNCPMADELVEEVNERVRAVEGVAGVRVDLTFDPVWSPDNLSEEARLELGL